jgi:hypothetical protein
MSVHDDLEEEGVMEGECPFTVHGLVGEQIENENVSFLRMKAMAHLNNQGNTLAIGHSEKPQSMYNNPQLYPQMFPWLFPYGCGGFKNTASNLSEKAHKRRLLMYYDKRFQKDPAFPLIAFNQEQIKDCTTGGFLLAEKKCFEDISDRLLCLDQEVLLDLVNRTGSGEVVKPTTDKEKACFKLMQDLDHVSGKVDGSITGKKYMRMKFGL